MKVVATEKLSRIQALAADLGNAIADLTAPTEPTVGQIVLVTPWEMRVSDDCAPEFAIEAELMELRAAASAVFLAAETTAMRLVHATGLLTAAQEQIAAQKAIVEAADTIQTHDKLQHIIDVEELEFVNLDPVCRERLALWYSGMEGDAAQRRVSELSNVGGLLRAMTDRFLSWKLPKDFSPDCGISFTPIEGSWPIGTNLLSADQATKMLFEVFYSLPVATTSKSEAKPGIDQPPHA